VYGTLESVAVLWRLRSYRDIIIIKMLFGVSLELYLSVLLIYLIFQSFGQVNASVGGIRVIYDLHLSLISSHCSLCFFLTCVEFIICCQILINLI